MAPLDERIERARLEREAQERRDNASWPPPSAQGRPGDGNPHIEPPSYQHLDATKKAFVGVWGIIAVIFAAAVSGWTAHIYWYEPLITATVKAQLAPMAADIAEMRKVADANQRSVELTLTEHKKDIEFLGRDQQKFETQALPAQPKKKAK
jgi:hypothetical protein